MAFNSYILSDAESRRIFEDEVVPNELQPAIQHHHHRDDGKQPLAVLLVGQTGAGKTRLAPVVRAAMVAIGRTPAHLIADTYKAYHPSYARIVAEKPAIASAATGSDARRWLTMACGRAVENRVDVLVESACRHPDDFCSLTSAFRGGGYVVRVAVLAVPEALSRLGILVRFHQSLPEARSGRLPLRLTPRKVHDDSYAGLDDAVAFVDESPAVDDVVVVRRGNLVAYSNRRTPGDPGRGWEGEAGAAAALRVERRRPLTEVERAVAVGDLEVLGRLDDPDVVAQIQEIGGLVDPVRDAVDLDEAATGVFPTLVPLDAMEFVSSGLV